MYSNLIFRLYTEEVGTMSVFFLWGLIKNWKLLSHRAFRSLGRLEVGSTWTWGLIKAGNLAETEKKGYLCHIIVIQQIYRVIACVPALFKSLELQVTTVKRDKVIPIDK